MSNKEKDTFIEITSADDFFEPLEVTRHELKANHRVVYTRDVPAGVMLDFMELEENDPNRSEALLKMISSAVCDKDGNRLLVEKSLDELRSMPMSVFGELASIVTGESIDINELDEDGLNPAVKD